MKAISLFASGGIGDLALKANDIHIFLANELLEDRCKVLSFNYPETEIIQGDIRERKDEIISKEKKHLKNPQARLNKSVKDKIKLIFLLKLLYITLPT